MSTRTKKLLSFLLVFALVLQMLPMSVFAEEVQLAEGSPIPITSHPDPADSMFCRDNKTEYKKKRSGQKYFSLGIWIKETRKRK